MREYNFGDDGNLGPTLSERYEQLLVSVGAPRTLDRGQVLYKQGDHAGYVYLLRAGRVKACSINTEGHETLLRVHLPGSLLGLTALGPRQVRDATTTAIEDSAVVAVRREQIHELFRVDGEFAIRLAELLVERVMSFQYRVHEVMANTIEQRIARTLLALGAHESDVGAKEHIGIALTHEELSHIVASRRQTVTLVLNRMSEAGLIRIGRGRIFLVDRDGLLRLIPT